MECFSERWNANWLTSERLEELLIEFFTDVEGETAKPKSITHLYAWLNQDWVELERRKTINDQYRKLLETAELMCEEWVINNGFESDRSFAKWYHDKFYGKSKEEIDITFNVIDPFT